VSWAGAELPRYRDRLYALAPQAAPAPDWQADWDGCSPLSLPAGCGRLAAAVAPAGRLSLHVRFRRGGERLRPHGDTHTRELRDLLQQAGVPPWQRGRLPLIYAGGELLAVADLWHTAQAEALLGGPLRYEPAV